MQQPWNQTPTTLFFESKRQVETSKNKQTKKLGEMDSWRNIDGAIWNNKQLMENHITMLYGSKKKIENHIWI